MYAALVEAGSNSKILHIIEEYAQNLHDSDDFDKLADNFAPLMHTIGLIWTHSPFFNSVSDIVLLLQCVCNDLIAQVSSMFCVYVDIL